MPTRPSVDFKALKAITFEQAVDFLTELDEPKREGDQLRFACPACKGGNKRALSINPARGFQCFEGKKSGNDAVALVAHVRSISNYDAGDLLEKHFLGKRAPSAVLPATGDRREPVQAPLGDQSHSVADLLGIPAVAVKALEAGYDKATKRFAIPLRAKTGVQVGTLGIATDAEQRPLLDFVFDEEGIQKANIGPDDLKKLFRVVG